MAARDPAWTAVMERYGHRCGCRGQCGQSHRDSRGRCPREHRDGGRAEYELLVVPMDPAAAQASAGLIPPVLLMAVCHACHGGINRRARAAAAAEPADQLDLFDPNDHTTEDTVTTPAVSTPDIIRVADALTAAHNAGISFRVGPNRFIRWSDDARRYVAVAPGAPVEHEHPATWDGGHALVVEYGDCELYGRCQCGADFGAIRPDRSIDAEFATAWERHVMTLPTH